MMNQKGMAPILIIVVILAIFVGGYYLGQQKIKPAPSPTQPTIQSSPNPADASPAPTGAGETANWKTYTNIKYSYLVKYPNTWKVSDCNGDGQTIHIADHQINCARAMPENGNIIIRVVAGDKIQTYISDRKQLGEVTASPITIDSITGIDLYLKPKSLKTEFSTNQQREIYLVKNNQTFLLNLIEVKDFNTENSLFNQILSTFKFIE